MFLGVSAQELPNPLEQLSAEQQIAVVLTHVARVRGAEARNQVYQTVASAQACWRVFSKCC